MNVAYKGVYTRNNGASRPDRTTEILEASPGPLLLRMASPNAIAFFIQASVSMTEVWYVGQLGTRSLASLALVFPLLMLMQMMAGGALGGAITSAIARALGAGRRESAAALAWHAIVVALAGGLIFWALYQLFGRALLVALGGTGDVLGEAQRYAAIMFGGSAAIWLAAISSSIFRGMGDMKFPAMIMIIGALLQIPLSGALILGWFAAPQLGIAGAAVSVVLVSCLTSMILLARLRARLAFGGIEAPFAWTAFRLRVRYFKDILRVGLFSSLSPVLTVLAVLGVTGLVGRLGSAALAGYGIGSRLEFLLIPLVFGIGTALTSTVGVNIGAGNVRRAEHFAWTGSAAAALIAGAVGVVLAIEPGLWLDLFTDDPAAYAAGAGYLTIVGPLFAFQGVGLALYFASQGAGRVVWPVIATALRLVVAVGGGALVLYVLDDGLRGIYVCIAASMLVYGAVTAGAIRLGAWRD